MEEKYKNKQIEFEFETVMHEISTAAMKYALVSTSCGNLIDFNIDKVCNFQDGSAPFMLYNAARFKSIQRKFENGVKEGIYPALPSLEIIDWSVLTAPYEWELLMDYANYFPQLVVKCACPPIPKFPALPEFPVHLLCDFVLSMVRLFSKYWASVQILKSDTTNEEATVMHARLYLLKALQQVLENALHMLTINPLQKM